MLGRGLALLDVDQVDKLMARHYTGEPIRSLIDEYGIPAQPSGMVGLFLAELREHTRPHSGLRLVRKWLSRDTRWLRAATCPHCRHVNWPRACPRLAVALEIRKPCERHPRQPTH